MEPYGRPAPSFLVSLVAGGLAGTSVDVALYPLDTIKTRLQSSQGFRAAGGFRGIYKGLSAAAVGSAPGAAAFFSSYEKAKFLIGNSDSATTHMSAATIAETIACLVRVPTENVKQKVQAGLHPSPMASCKAIIKADGLRGFYKGYGTTVMREIPFSLIQFPLYEWLKLRWAKRKGTPYILPVESALCGSVSGAFAAGLTTPFDVAKTRIMLGKGVDGIVYTGMVHTLRRIAAEEGYKALFSGLVPRVTWIGIGGFVFFGVYEGARNFAGKVVSC